ncbi:MAG: ROK family protein [Parvularculaceae bacterium]
MRIGVDLGGTKIEAAVLDARGGVIARQRKPAPVNDYDATLETIRDLVNAVASKAGDGDPARPVGVGAPGASCPKTGLVKNANSVWLNGRPLQRDLESALRRPVRLANDANCFAISEARDGAGVGAEVVFGVILGTGVGGGLVVGGRPLTGPRAIAGEWGHAPLPWPRDDERPGAPCYCGKAGCIETWASGAGLSRAYGACGGDDRTGAAEVAERARAGETAARDALSLYEDRLARGLAMVVNLIDPDVIVLGGGLSNIARLYDSLPVLMEPWIFDPAPGRTPVLRNMHGDSGGVRGAAWLWEDGG